MEYGTGKSYCLLHEWGELVMAGEVRDLLIWAPSGCYLNWTTDRSEEQRAEINKHLPDWLRDQMVCAEFRAGGRVRDRERIERMLRADRPRLLVVNVEAMSTVKAARDLCAEFVTPRTMVAVDESPVIKSHDRARTAAILAAREKSVYRRILTGRVMVNNPLDLYSQYEFLSWRILKQRSFYGFKARYAIEKTIGGVTETDARGCVVRDAQGNVRRVRGPKGSAPLQKIPVAYRNLEELGEMLEPHGFRALKSECLDIPDKVYLQRDVEMTDEQRRVYRDMLDIATAQLDSGEWVSSQLPLTLMMRLQQIVCGHVKDDEGIVRPVKSARLRALMESLEDHDGKAVIWTCFDYSVREIAAELGRVYGERAVARYWGGNRSTREEDQRRFLGDPDCRFMVSTQGAGGAGNTWTVAGLEVYYSNNYRLDQRENSEDRLHRDGASKTVPVTVLDLIARGTVDERILHALRKKMDLAAMIDGDNWREWVV
jgi:hypothetical protein